MKYIYPVLIASSLLIAGCTTITVLTNREEIPVSATTSSAPTGSKAPSDAFLKRDMLDVDDLVTEVHRRNPSLEALQHLWQATAERPSQVRALDDPMLNYGLAPGTIGSDDLVYGQKLDISQKLPWPGKRGLRADIARSEAEAALTNVDDARRLIEQRTRQTFYHYYYVHRAIEINNTNVELLNDLYRLAEDKYAAGKVSRQDALQAEVEKNHLEHRAITLERQRKVARARINALLSRKPELPIPAPPRSISEPGDHPDITALRTRAVNARPELQGLARRIEGRRASVELARKDYYPDFTVMGTYNSLWQKEEQRGFVGVGINIPLGKDRDAALRERHAELDAESAKLAAAVDRVALEVTEAYEEMVESEHVVRLYKSKLIPSADDNLKAARADYEAAKTDILTLLTAEKNQMLVQLALENALAEYHTREANLDAAVGSRN